MSGRIPPRPRRPAVEALEGRALLTVFFDQPSYLVSDQAGAASITLRRDFTVGEDQVTLSTSDGTAVAGQDYTATTRVVTFRNGAATQTVDIPVADRGLDNAEKTVALKLTSPDAASQPPSRAVLTIADRTDLTPPTADSSKLITRGNAVTGVSVTFSKPMDPGPVQDVRNYSLSAFPRNFRPGRFLPPGPLALKSATYDAATRTVTLTLAKPSTRSMDFTLSATGPSPVVDASMPVMYPPMGYDPASMSPLTDTAGNHLDGNHDGIEDGSFFLSLPGRPFPTPRFHPPIAYAPTAIAPVPRPA